MGLENVILILLAVSGIVSNIVRGVVRIPDLDPDTESVKIIFILVIHIVHFVACIFLIVGVVKENPTYLKLSMILITFFVVALLLVCIFSTEEDWKSLLVIIFFHMVVLYPIYEAYDYMVQG